MPNVLFQTIINDVEYPRLYEFMHSNVNKVYRAHLIKRAVEEYLGKRGDEDVKPEELMVPDKQQDIILPTKPVVVSKSSQKSSSKPKSIGPIVSMNSVEDELGDDFLSSNGIR